MSLKGRSFLTLLDFTPAEIAELLALAAKLPATIFNGVVAIIFAPILIVAIKAALKKNHLEI